MEFAKKTPMTRTSQMVEGTSHRYQLLQVAALRLSSRAAPSVHLTPANRHNHREGDPVPEAKQGAVLYLEDILDPKGRSNSRVPAVRNSVQQGTQHQTWAS
ncbi:hypothetical protein MRX96_030486 [Rhipicephalus microplus]